MSDIQRGQTFTTSVTAAMLHALADNATILPGFISGKTQVVPVSVDSFVFYQSGSGNLMRCLLSDLVTAFPRGGANGTYALRQLGSLAGQACAGNDVRLPHNVTGIRLGAGAASNDTAAAPKDLVFPPVNLSGVTAIDWSASAMFYDSLTGDKTYTFSNQSAGQVIRVIVTTNGHNVTMPALYGALQTTGTGTTGQLYTFVYTGGGIVGTCVNF